jgi:putative protein kinase ArgK-like GTPase of G3E family
MANAPLTDELRDRPDDVIIGVVGVTGAGKSTFIQKCCDGAIDIVGHDLTSCKDCVWLISPY